MTCSHTTHPQVYDLLTHNSYTNSFVCMTCSHTTHTQVYDLTLVCMIGIMHISLYINKSYFHTNEYTLLCTLIRTHTQVNARTLIGIHYKQTAKKRCKNYIYACAQAEA